MRCVARMQFYMVTKHLLGVMWTCKISVACARGEYHHVSECRGIKQTARVYGLATWKVGSQWVMHPLIGINLLISLL